jgi:tetratricopeptide (TPR) repeat protein
MQQDQAAQAAQKLERVEGYLATDPTNKELLANAIDLSLACGQPERAQQHAEAALSLDPADVFFQARQGNVMLAQRNWKQAAQLFEPILAAHPDVHIAYNLAYAYVWQGLHGQACDALAPYAHQADLEPSAVTLLLRAMHHMGEFDAAIALVQEHEARCTGDAGFLGAASLLCLDAGQLEEAGRLSKLAMAGAVRPPEAMVVAGTLSLARADTDAAIAQFKEVLAVKPMEGRSWSGLGMASLLKRDLGAAAEQLEQALRFMPFHIGTWHSLAWCKIFAKDLAGAEAAFGRALELDRNFGDSHGGLAVVAAMQGKREVADAAIARALGLDKQSLSARYAQMILAGQTEDPVQFNALAMRLLSSRQSMFGANMAEMVQSALERS